MCPHCLSFRHLLSQFFPANPPCLVSPSRCVLYGLNRVSCVRAASYLRLSLMEPTVLCWPVHGTPFLSPSPLLHDHDWVYVCACVCVSVDLCAEAVAKYLYVWWMCACGCSSWVWVLGFCVCVWGGSSFLLKRRTKHKPQTIAEVLASTHCKP